jgi:hypothetical protein
VFEVIYGGLLWREIGDGWRVFSAHQGASWSVDEGGVGPNPLIRLKTGVNGGSFEAPTTDTFNTTGRRFRTSGVCGRTHRLPIVG